MRARALFALGLAACAGRVSSPSDAAAEAGAADATADVAAETGPSCADLKAQVDALRTQAQTCCPICTTQQCGHAVMDVCCSISITAATAPQFSAAVAAYLAECPPDCPGSPCPQVPSLTCVSSDPSNPSASGVCM